jgi:O-antigen/teichoic acid export membrane protein
MELICRLLKDKPIALIIDQGVVSLFRFFIGIILARSLGVVDYGYYVILWSIYLFVTSIHIPLIVNPMLTYSGSMKIEQRSLAGYMSIVQLLFSISAMVFLFVGFSIYEYCCGVEVNIFLVVLAIVFVNLHDFLRRFFLNDNVLHLKVLFVDVVLYSVLVLIVSMLYVRGELTLDRFFLIYFVLAVLSCVYMFKFYNVLYISKSEVKVVYSKISSHSFDQVFFSFMQFMSGNFFTYISVVVLGTYSAGVIGIIRNLYSPIIVISMVFDSIMPKRAKFLAERSRVDLRAYVHKVLIFFSVIGLIFVVSVAYFSYDIVYYFYGVDYIEYASLSLWVAVAYFLMFLAKPLSIYCRSIDLTKTFLRQGWTVFVVTFILSYPLVYFFDLVGALSMMLIQQFIIMYFLLHDSNYLYIDK